MKGKSEVTIDLSQAYDLKSKGMNLMKACSDFLNYIGTRTDQVQKLSSQLSEIHNIIEKAENEKDLVERSLKTAKAEYETFKKDREAQIAKFKKEEDDVRRKNQASLDDYKQMVESARKKEVANQVLLEENSRLNKELKAKLEKIAEISGSK